MDERILYPDVEMTCDRPDVQVDRPDVESIHLEDCQIMVVESENDFPKSIKKTRITWGILGGESRKVNGGGGLLGCDPNKGGDGVKSGRRRSGGDGLDSRRVPLFPVSDCITPFSFIFSTGFKRASS